MGASGAGAVGFAAALSAKARREKQSQNEERRWGTVTEKNGGAEV
jgi:hypothetical protein